MPSPPTQKSGVEVEFRVAANPPFEAHGHDGRYGQVFRNVIDNALSFSPRARASSSS